MKYRNYIFTSALSALSLIASDKDLTQLEPIIVEATRYEQPIMETGSSISVLTAKDLENFQQPRITEVLKTVPGINIRKNGGPGTVSSLSIRGTATSHTLILIDGVEVKDPTSNSNYPIDLIPSQNVERIEILKGNQSALYGADAVGGVINIITKDGGQEQGNKSTITAEGGSYDTYRVSASTRGNYGDFNYSLFAQNYETEGFSAARSATGAHFEDDDFEQKTVHLKAGYRASENVSINGLVTYSQSQSDFDSGSGLDDVDNFTDSTHWSTALSSEIAFGDGRLISKPLISYNQSKRENDAFTISSFKGQNYRMDLNNVYTFNEHYSITGGYEYEIDDAQIDNEGFANAPGRYRYNEDLYTQSLYLNNIISPLENLNFELGGRWDDNEKFGNEETWRTTLSYLFPSIGTRVKGTYGTSFRAPNVDELFNPEWGNGSLKAESGRSYEFSLEQSLFGNQIQLGSTYFVQKMKNQISYDFSQLKFINLDNTASKGVESFIQWNALRNLTFSINHTYTDAQDITNNKDLARIPKHQLAGNINWQAIENWNINLNTLYVGKRFDRSNEQNPNTSYLIWNLASSYKINNNWKVFGRIDNLLDKDYQEIIGFNTPERSAYLGVELSF
jgi:vitamin B12 transporter